MSLNERFEEEISALAKQHPKMRARLVRAFARCEQEASLAVPGDAPALTDAVFATCITRELRRLGKQWWMERFPRRE
jgi:hypothetical protein